MVLQLSTDLRNNQAAQVESTLGVSPKLQIRTGAPPANCAAADAGSLLVEITLPADWLTSPTSGVVSRNGTWQGVASGTGTAGHFRVKNEDGTVTHMQGTVSITGDGGDMEVNNTSVAVTQTVTISTFTYTRGNA